MRRPISRPSISIISSIRKMPTALTPRCGIAPGCSRRSITGLLGGCWPLITALARCSTRSGANFQPYRRCRRRSATTPINGCRNSSTPRPHGDRRGSTWETLLGSQTSSCDLTSARLGEWIKMIAASPSPMWYGESKLIPRLSLRTWWNSIRWRGLKLAWRCAGPRTTKFSYSERCKALMAPPSHSTVRQASSRAWQ